MSFLSAIPRIGRSSKLYPFFDRSILRGGDSRNFGFVSFILNLVPLEKNVSPQQSCFSPIPLNSHLKSTQSVFKKSFSTTNRVFKGVSLSQIELKRAIEELTDQFMETRELLEDARESVGTVYFSDDMQEASDAVTKTLEDYQELLSIISSEQKQEVMRTIGLKMEELKAQQQALNEDQYSRLMKP